MTPNRRIAGALVLLAASSLWAPRCFAQSASLACLDPVSRECEYVTKPGTAKIPINVRVIGAGGVAADTASVSFTASHCCLSEISVRTNATGIASVVWDGPVPSHPDSAVRIEVRAATAGHHLQNTVRVRPQRLPAPVRYALMPVDSQYVWFRDDQIPGPVNFLVEDDSTGESVTQEECAKVQVTFTPHLQGSAGPGPASARWNPDTGTCTVGATWRLANAVGEQYLNASIVGLTGRDRVDANVRAISRHPPRFVGGFGVMAEKEEGENRVMSIFGVDFPVFHERTCAAGICKNLRLVLGSSFEDPQDDYYVGVVLIPLFWGPSREGIPIQVSANYANGGRVFGALAIDAGGLLQFALTKLLPS